MTRYCSFFSCRSGQTDGNADDQVMRESLRNWTTIFFNHAKVIIMIKAVLAENAHEFTAPPQPKT